MRKKGFWITENAAEVAEWCSKYTEISTFELLYQGTILVFETTDDGEEILFRLKWGHLIWP
ncbi:hypothetical protein C8J25_101860 [Sphingomonas faeni]|uniref:Uncharacterized protein n=1 Tax=Sphingomonas faeni TaxID=185950 RepID=A0A2T5UCV9_9SPHN|nr:hypothetical protein C8J25_101860 [Sphingomonas faeni]